MEGRPTRQKKVQKGVHVLEIIHTDICCPDVSSSGHNHFILFIDDYSEYMYLCLLHNEDKPMIALNAVKHR